MAAADLSHFHTRVCVCRMKANEIICVWVSICVKRHKRICEKYASIRIREKYAVAIVELNKCKKSIGGKITKFSFAIYRDLPFGTDVNFRSSIYQAEYKKQSHIFQSSRFTKILKTKIDLLNISIFILIFQLIN